MFYHKQLNLRCGVHADDVLTAGNLSTVHKFCRDVGRHVHVEVGEACSAKRVVNYVGVSYLIGDTIVKFPPKGYLENVLDLVDMRECPPVCTPG